MYRKNSKFAELESLASTTRLPVIIGSGLTPDNTEHLMRHADAAIVGSAFKEDGNWKKKISPHRVDNLVKKFL